MAVAGNNGEVEEAIVAELIRLVLHFIWKKRTHEIVDRV